MAKVATAIRAKPPSLWDVAVFICVTIVCGKLTI
jgi:hypothetical protein